MISGLINSIYSHGYTKTPVLTNESFLELDGARGGTWSLPRPRPASPHIRHALGHVSGYCSDSSPRQLDKKLLFFRYRSVRYSMVPEGGLEPPHLSAYAPQAYMSTIPSPGHKIWIYLFLYVYPSSLRSGGMALEYSLSFISNRTSTIPSLKRKLWCTQ